MDDLPELPFEKVLSYLSLEELIKAMAVSRRWYHVISSFRVNRLCYSELSCEVICKKSRAFTGGFPNNFITSPRFESFFKVFAGKPIFSNLKLLRLSDLGVDQKNRTGFVRAVNSFDQLEELAIIRFNEEDATKSRLVDLELNLPMLARIHLERVEIKLTLDAPRLQKVKLSFCSSLNLNLVHAESVETLITRYLRLTAVKQMKNLAHLHIEYLNYYAGIDSIDSIDPTFLSDLEQLKEIHLFDSIGVSELFDQKQRYGRVDLKIYIEGSLLSGPDDPATSDMPVLNEESYLAEEMPFRYHLPYRRIELMSTKVDPDFMTSFVHRLTDLKEIRIDRRVQDAQRFLDFLGSFGQIVSLSFECGQLQDLFNRLPEHCAVEQLSLYTAPSDLGFLLRLKQLIQLSVSPRSFIDAESCRNIFEELQSLSSFGFVYNQTRVQIFRLKRFSVWLNAEKTEVPDLEATIQLIFENKLPKTQMAKCVLL